MAPRPAAKKTPPAKEPKADSPAAEAPKKRRNLMTEVLDISISNARCQSHMKAALIPPQSEALLAEKRAALKAAKEGGADDEAVAAAKAEIDEIVGQTIRIGGDAPIAVAAVCDYVVKSAVRYSMDQTLEGGHKMVEIAALHAGNPASLDVWPLICDLPAVATYDPEKEAALKAQRAAENKAQKEAREAAKKAREAGEATPAAGAAAAPADKPAGDDEDEEAHGPSTTFHTYVDAATTAVKKEESYSAMRVSNRLREVLSDVVAELVARFTLIAKVTVLELMGVRTLNASHLLSMVKGIYVTKLGVEEHAGLESVLAYTSGKVTLYHEHVKAEKDRRWEEMDAEKKAEAEAKAAATAAEGKKKAAARAREKARELAQKAKTLEKEVAKA